MSDNSDASTSPIIAKGKRRAPILTTASSESESDSSIPKIRGLERYGRRKNRIRESDSDSSIEKPRKAKRVARVTSDAESDSAESDIINTRTSVREVVSENSDDYSESNNSDGSETTDNGFEDEDNTSDDHDWESDWMSDSSEVEDEPSSPIKIEEIKPNKKEDMEPSTSNAPCVESDSSDGESEKCPICLLSFNNQEVGTPETCDHSFCAECIQEWSRNVNTCPVDRLTFTLVLVRKRYGGKVIRRVPVDVKRDTLDELIQEDPTYCEVCGMSDREDRLLLCDGCDLGYHLECLEPPMENVPIEEWFCSECRLPTIVHEAERREIRRHRHEPRLLPRTSQMERIRATIEINRSSALNLDLNSLSSGFEDTAIPGTSRTTSTITPTTVRGHQTIIKRKTKRKAKRKSRAKKRRPVILYYEIDDKTGQKVAVKKKCKRKKRKTKRKRAIKERRTVQPKTVKKRLAFQLGICAPKKVGLAIPEVKNKANSNSVGNIGLQRSLAGIPTLHLFGQRDQLDYFSASDEDAPGISSSGGLLTHARTASSEASAMRRAARRKAVFAPEPLATVSSCDILGQILSTQEKLHSKNSVISVARDGTIHIKNESRNKSESNNNLIQDNTELETSTSPSPEIDKTTEIETTQAPMFPNRGGGNRQPYFHRGGGGNYRGGGGGYDGGNSNYNHYGGPPRAHRGGYGGYNHQRDNNFGGGYFHHGGGGPTPPFRGRGGPRFPMRRPPLQPPPPQPRIVEPIELVLDDPREHNLNDNSTRHEEDVDIYSDIEAASSPQIEEESYKPHVNQQVQAIAQTFNNSGTDDDSGSELVIDDTVKEVDKYDPADPSNDTDSNSEAIAVIKEPESNEIIPDSEMEQPSKPECVQMDDETFETENLFETSLSQLVETTKLTNLSPQIVSDAVQQVLKEHMSNTTPTRGPSSSLVNYDDDEDSSDDCPNFSIYSATSIDIAKATELSVNIPKQDEISTEILAEQPDKIEDIAKEESKELPEGVIEESEEMQEAEMREESIQEPINMDDEIEEPIMSSKNELLDGKELSDGEIVENDDNSPEDKIESENDIIVNTKEELIDLLKDQPEDLPKDLPKDEEKVEEIEKADNIISDCKNIDYEKKSSESSIQTKSEVKTPAVFLIKKQTTPIKIAFDPKRKLIVESTKKERVLQLYDDSDLEEWEYKNEFVKLSETDNEKPQETKVIDLEKMTEAISEEERSYTPCLDEKEPQKLHLSDDEQNIGAGIGGMDTELISDDERNDIFDESHDMKTISDGDALEINAKESELDLTRPEDYEEGEIVEKLAAKILQAVDEPQVEEHTNPNSDDEKKKRLKKKVIEKVDKNKEVDKGKKPEFKKISKSNKERNYRDKEKARSRSREKKSSKENKENRRDKLRKEKKKDLVRYNVRSLIAEKPKKDQFGRDIDRTPSRSSRSVSPSHTSRRSASRNRRSLSWNKTKKRRRRTRSPKRSRSRTFSRGHTPKSRSRGKSIRNRSRSVRRSRSPRRSRSRSFRRSRSPRNKRYRAGHRSLSRERYRNRSRRRSQERTRGKKKIRSISRTKAKTRTPSPPKQRPRDWERKRSFEREWTPSWSRSPSARPDPRHNLPESISPSWTPPPAIEKGPVQPENLTVILTNNDVNKAKKKDKKKKGEKKQKDDYRKRKRSDRTPPPSKEVFASGDNILVSVSFNKTNEDNTREVLGVKRKRETLLEVTAKKTKKDKNLKEKKKRAKSPKTKRKNKEVANMKPVAIIDLDRSPFKELTPSPKDIIVLSDSDNCEKEDENIHDQLLQEEMMESQNQEDSAPQSPNYLNSTGPKTPPEPQIKFLLSTKQTQLRAISNPLHDPNDEGEVELDPQEELEHRLEDVLHKGPNTPPEPPSSPLSSPDAYDPFDPTKSRSPTPEPQTANLTNSSEADKVESDGDLVDLAVGPLESSQKSIAGENAEKRAGSLDRTKRLSSSPDSGTQARTSPNSSTDNVIEIETKDSSDKNSKSPERISIGVVINQQIQQPTVVKPIISTAVYSSVTPTVITSAPALNSTLPRTNLFSTSSTVTPRIATSVPQRIILPTPAKSSPAKMSPLKSSPAKLPIKSTPIKPMPSKTMISKLPVPNVKPLTPVRNKKSRPMGQNGNEVIDVDLDFESPYSPGSSDYEDLFEPPVESMNSKRSKNMKSPAKGGGGGGGGGAFDNLFGSSPVFRPQNNKKGKTNTKVPVKLGKKSGSAKGQSKTHIGVKIDEDNLKILDDLPNSAVEMQVKDKVCITSQQLPNSEFLKKLNRQERVVEEVKLVLKPHYNKKHVTKDQYKDILRRAVPKICHNKSGEINPKKIQNLIEAYVKKARQHKKPATTNPSTTGTATQSKTAKTTFWS